MISERIHPARVRHPVSAIDSTPDRGPREAEFERIRHGQYPVTGENAAPKARWKLHDHQTHSNGDGFPVFWAGAQGAAYRHNLPRHSTASEFGRPLHAR